MRDLGLPAQVRLGPEVSMPRGAVILQTKALQRKAKMQAAGLIGVENDLVKGSQSDLNVYDWKMKLAKYTCRFKG
jgi:hypothetical protein